MELEVGILNCFFIDSALKWGRISPYEIYMNATESEFKELLEGYLSENESQDGPDFSIQRFSKYVAKNGYYVKTKGNFILPPYAPFK